jgi:hypothetical protein
MKMAAFWDVALSSLIEVDRRLRGTYYLHHQEVRTSETSTYFKETTRRYIPEGCHLHTHCRENLRTNIRNISLTNHIRS